MGNPFIRWCLYIIELIWTCVVLGVSSAQLRTTRSSEPYCLLDSNPYLMRCNFIIAWSAIAFIVVLIAVVLYIFQRYTCEFVTHSWLAVWWFVAAVTLSAVRSGSAGSARTVVAFSWMLVILFVASAGLVKWSEEVRLDLRERVRRRQSVGPGDSLKDDEGYLDSTDGIAVGV